jgi:hypothetical protein
LQMRLSRTHLQTMWLRLPSSTLNSITPSPTPRLGLGTRSQCSQKRHRTLLTEGHRYRYNHWRPVTAIHREGIWLESGRDISDPAWVPLLRPTPSHPDYTSTHATFGGAGAAVLKDFNGGDKIDATFSSNVTLDAQGVITKRYRSIDRAAYDNERSRIYGGVSRNSQ